MIRNWRKKKDAVAKQPKGQRTGIVKFPALETTLTEWIVNQRECSRAVTIVMIWPKARELAKQMNVADFVGGQSWYIRFDGQSVRKTLRYYY